MKTFMLITNHSMTAGDAGLHCVAHVDIDGHHVLQRVT